MFGVSVVVVSRARPRALTRCLLGLSQLDYPAFEVVVVACPEGIAAAQASPQAEQLKLVPFDEPNISAARNLGIRAAAREIVAFIDDDAVPEPLWLRHLIPPFEQPDVAAAGGFVLGRNGISFQWKARTIDETGEASDMALDTDAPVILALEPGRAIKTEGTNMAVRRSVLAEMGGFDPGFHFYLDETDLNWRLARAGHRTAIVPLAQVHHGFEASDRRGTDRTPRDLTQIGASKMLFLRKHCPKKQQKAAWRRFCKEQRLRLLRLMQRGPLGADDVWRLLSGLRKGGRDGAIRPTEPLLPLEGEPPIFKPFTGRPGAGHQAFAGRSWNAASLRKEAENRAREGKVVTLILLSPTRRRHRVRFTDSGVWEQRGGLFGPSLREGRSVQLWTFPRRVRAEIRRVAPVRGLPDEKNRKN